MSQKNLVDNLHSIEIDLKEIRTVLKKAKPASRPNLSIKKKCEKVSIVWFKQIKPNLSNFQIEENILKYYDEQFSKLLELSTSTSRTKAYLLLISSILLNFKKDLTLQEIKSFTPSNQFNYLDNILDDVSEIEHEYFVEALDCIHHNCFRASVVLGWSAAVFRMQNVVEKKGFDEFNKKSKEMSTISVGRYKRFSKLFNIHNLSELQSTVFDNDLLWILEYWGLIDSNQRDRLGICAIMRNNAGHPGRATISYENLLSFYSDLRNYIFNNKNFALEN